MGNVYTMIDIYFFYLHLYSTHKVHIYYTLYYSIGLCHILVIIWTISQLIIILYAYIFI